MHPSQSTVLTNIVDLAVTLCDLKRWEIWTSYALSADPLWPQELLDNIYRFRQKVISAIWPPGSEEFKRATVTFSVLVVRAANIFMEHSELKGNTYFPLKFYKQSDWNPNYDDDLKRYNRWRDLCYSSIYDATKAANWFADAVRTYVDPTFFVNEGKFLISEEFLFGEEFDLGFYTRLLEFNDEEKAEYPEKAFPDSAFPP